VRLTSENNESALLARSGGRLAEHQQITNTIPDRPTDTLPPPLLLLMVERSCRAVYQIPGRLDVVLTARAGRSSRCAVRKVDSANLLLFLYTCKMYTDIQRPLRVYKNEQ